MEWLFYALVLGWLAVISWWARRLYIAAVQFVTAPAPGEVSPLGQFMQATATILANQVVMSVKGTLMGQASAVSKAEAGIQTDILQDTVAMNSPMLGMILEAFPSLRKRVSKSAVARLALANMDLGKLLNKGGNGHAEGTENTGETSRASFQL